MIKIWTKKDLSKGFIPNDKITYRGVSFEIYGLSNFDKTHLNHKKILNLLTNCRRMGKINDLIFYIKAYIQESEVFKRMELEGYHTHIYLNLNFNGVDCFISR